MGSAALQSRTHAAHTSRSQVECKRSHCPFFIIICPADTPEVCENILANVRLNAELQPRPLPALLHGDAAAARDLSHDVYRASCGSISVLPLTWDSSDLPHHLQVSRRSSSIICSLIHALHSDRRISSSPATACLRNRSSPPSWPSSKVFSARGALQS